MGRQRRGAQGVEDPLPSLTRPPSEGGMWHLASALQLSPGLQGCNGWPCPHGLAPPSRSTKYPEHGSESPPEFLTSLCECLPRLTSRGCPVGMLQARLGFFRAWFPLLLERRSWEVPRLQPLS